VDIIRYARAALGTIDYAKRKLLAERRVQLQEFMASSARHSFPRVAAPRVSIVILAYNHAYHTLQCLLSVLDMVDSQTEVIVFDNGSSDETAELLKRFDNLVIGSIKDNVGFVRGMNAATKYAKGKYMALLNNDARLISGSIAKAADAFEATPSCGYMGFRVMHANGGLQEAGCMIFQDGTTSCYLRYHSHHDPRALFRRDVDFCSGVFFIVEREIFTKMGGFDEYYVPAYYEETDLCMRLRQSGLRCVYYPNFLVEHFEFGSGSSSNAARTLISKNRTKFLNRWLTKLVEQGFTEKWMPGHVERAALRLQPRPHRLVVLVYEDFDAELIRERVKQPGSLTIALMQASSKQVLEVIEQTDMVTEIINIKGKRELQRLISGDQRKFEKVEILGKAKEEIGGH
jgi:GT2 family glycosyltransferase